MKKFQQIFHIDMNFLMMRHDLFKPYLEKIAAMGYNAVLWEVEDKIQWETCPECVHPEAFTKEEFAEILSYSRSLGLEPIPLLQTLGHGEYVMCHEEYAHLREVAEYSDCYCVSKPGVSNLLKSWISEYLDLFGDISEFHLGGDEAYSFGQCPVCAEEIRKHDTLSLAMAHYALITEELIRAGVRPNIWFDMLIHHPEEVKSHLVLLKRFRIWDWHYNRTFENPCTETLDMLQNKFALDVIPCSAARAWGDRVGCPAAHRAENAAVTAKLAAERGLSGYCTTSWSVRLVDPFLQTHIMAAAPRMAAEPQGDFKEILKQSVCQQYGVSDAEKLIAAANLCTTAFPLSAVHELGICWDRTKTHTPVRHGWLKDSLTQKQDVWSNFDFAAAEADLDRAELLLKECNAPEIWLDAVSFQKDLLDLSRAVLHSDPAGKEKLKKVRQKTRLRYQVWQEKLSAESCVNTLFGALEDLFSE